MSEIKNLEHEYEPAFELAEELDELLIQVSTARHGPARRAATDIGALELHHLAEVLRLLAATLASATPIAHSTPAFPSLPPALIQRLERDDELRTALSTQLPTAADRLDDGHVEALGAETVDALSHLASIAEAEASSAHWRATRL